ncbi:MAG: tetratricopeptide repeat protein [Planctomycetes bacterium]|nr:tetratricopeptide repeat protein [Planctomycetota bacterium]
MGLFDFLKKKPGETPQPADKAAAPSPAQPSAATPTPAATPGGAPVKAGPASAATPSTAPAPAPAPAPAAPAKPEPAEFVEVLDGLGRRVRIPRDEYRQKVLPDLLKQHANNPDQLAAVILQGLRDGLASDLVPSAIRLTVVDKDVERALSILAIVQRDAGELDSAERTLHELAQKRPNSPSSKVGLGMLAISRGQRDKAEELFWAALQMDCNHADAVHGWLQVRHQAVGDAGYRAEIEKVAALPSAWRAPLWLARHLAQTGDLDGATRIWRDVVANAGGENDALVMASGDLVQLQKHDLTAELIVPRFQPGRHHPHVGLALLHHYLQKQDDVAGAALLHQMYLYYGHLIPAELQPFTAEFDRMRLAKLPPPAPMTPTSRIGLYRLDRPIWYAGLEDPMWLLPPKQPNAKSLLFFSLAVEGQQSLPPGREDELGRLTRSLPLFLAEQAWLSTPHRGTAVLPMAEQGGWAIMGRPWPEEQLIAQVPEGERKDTLLVTGVLRVDGDKRRIDLWVYDCGQKQRIGHAAAEGAMADVGRMLLQLLAELWPVFGGPAGHKPPVGDEGFWQRYSDGLGQHAALVVTQAGGMPRERLYGERYITQWLQTAALSETRWQPGFWLLASSLCVLHQMGSPIPKEHARLVAEVFRQSPPNSAFARIGARVLRACGLDAMWQARRAEIVAAAGNDPAFQAWLLRAEAAK